MYVCPICHKQLKNKHGLDEHMKRVHGGQPSEPALASPPPAASKPKAKDLNLKLRDEDKVTYKCGACNHVLDGQLSPCPYCGAELSWEVE